MKVFQALYNPMTEESGYITLSIHLSWEGAENAIKEHKEKELESWREIYPNTEEEPYPFATFQDWFIRVIEILP